MRRLRLVYVSNKVRGVSESDFRLIYPKISGLCSVIYVLPEKPPSISESCFVQMNFGEGFRLQYVIELLRLWKYLQKNRPRIDMVHFYSTILILLGPAVARLAGIPSIVTITGMGRTFSSTDFGFHLLRPIYLLLFRVSLQLTSRVLCQTKSDLAFLVTRFPSAARKFAYVGSGLSMASVHDKDFSAPQLKILLVARIRPDKGIYDFLAVAEKLYDQGPFKFILIGPSSPGCEKLLKTVWDHDSAGIITYMGELSPAETLEQFSEGHIFFFPSFYGEGLSRVLLECGFARMCPVAYDLPINHDLVAKEQGFLVKKGDTEAVASLINALERDRGSLEANAIAYGNYISNCFNMDVFTKRMDDLLLDIATENGIQ